MKNILFISYDGMTDPLGQSQVIPYLSGLALYGYSFTILSCDKPSLYAANREYVNEQLQGLPIQWVSIPYHKSPPVLSSIYDLWQIKRAIRKLQAEKPFDLVHTRPGIPTLAALWMKRRFGTKFLNDIRGFWADERVDGGMWDIKNPLYKMVYRFFKKHEQECLVGSSYNTCLTEAAKMEMLSWPEVGSQPKLTVIPCSADLELFNPAAITSEMQISARQKFGIKPDDIIISYLGSIGGWYLTDDMMRFCRQLSEKIPSSKFLFISPHRHDQIAAAAARFGINESKLVTTQAKRHEVPLLLSLSNYSLFFIKPCYSKISSSPTKHGEIMAMGIPVITNGGVGDVKAIVDKYSAGYVVEDFTHASFEKVIQAIVNGQAFDSKRIRQGATEIYSLSKAVEQYRFVYEQILQ